MIALLLLFTLFSSFVSLSQIALFSLSSSTVKLYSGQPGRRPRLIARLLGRPKELLVTLLMCDIGANILVQNSAADLFGEMSGWLLKVGVPLLLTLFLGEIIPKTLALANNKRIALAVVPAINILAKILTPVRLLLTKVTSTLSQFLFFFLKHEEEISKEELHAVLKSSERHGVLTPSEAELADGYLSLTDTTVKERMRPRHEIYVYSLTDSIDRLLYLFVEKECSRVPVCEQDDLQTMIGILSANDYFASRDQIREPTHIRPLLTKPHYVPETIAARALLKHFLHSPHKMGIVVDEYGTISGLITQEDLIEVVVGEITDRRDEKVRYTPAGENVIITSGKFELSEFEDVFGVELPSESHMVTLGGWLTEQLGEIPKSGTKYTWQGFLFQVLASDPQRVRRIYIRRMAR